MVESKSKLRCTTFIEVRDRDGKLIASRVKEDDLLLNNFRNIALYVEITRYGSVSVRAEDGVEKTCSHTHVRGNDKIAIGTGTTAPARNNYALVTKVAEADTATVTLGVDYVTYAQSITLTVARDITEAGYFVYCASCEKWFMLIRDTFAAVPVPEAGTISITFQITM